MKEAINIRMLRSAPAASSFVLLVGGTTLLPALAFRRFGPRNLLTSINPLIDALLIPVSMVTPAIMTLACCMFGIFIGGSVWLILMKPFFTENEMRTILGFAPDKARGVTRIIRKVVDLIY